jgi:prepilin-type N-terminal cleavage/methylation domain-containing protein
MRGRQAGLTLVELMVTMVVASLVAASTFVFFTSQQRIYDTQTKLLTTQQNVSAAMEMMVRYVRAAGAGMTGCVRPPINSADTGDPGPVTTSTALTSAPATGLRAYLYGTGTIRIPPFWLYDGTSGAPDVLTVAFGNGTFGNWSDNDVGVDYAAPTAALTTTAGGGNAFRAGDFVVLVDSSASPSRASPLLNDRGCSMLQVTSIVGNVMTFGPYPTSNWNPATAAAGTTPITMVPFTYSAAATAAGIRHFGTINWVRFAIRAGTATTPPALTMERLDLPGSGPQVLADGIEDLQVAYACDTLPAPAGDGAIPEGSNKLTDEWVLNASGDTIPTNCNRPSAVRLSLIARSLAPDTLLSGLANVKPAIENGAVGAASDQYRRRVMTATVYPRN